MLIWVSFEDATEAVVNGQFGGPQPIESFPFQGQIETSDPRWHTFYEMWPEYLRMYLPTAD